jgi:hypothetical protein
MTYQYLDEGVWYDEGTGKLSAAHHRAQGYSADLEWREKPMACKNKTKGLYDKFMILRKEDANFVDYPCFVLRIDGTDPIAMNALKTYAEKCDDPLSSSLLEYIQNTPIKLKPEQIIDKAGYIIDRSLIEGISNEEYSVLEDLLELAKQGLKKDD